MSERVPINRTGYQVTIKTSEGFRSYGIVNKAALEAFILQLTGRKIATYPCDYRGIPVIGDVTINYPFYIWGSQGED